MSPLSKWSSALQKPAAKEKKKQLNNSKEDASENCREKKANIGHKIFRFAQR